MTVPEFTVLEPKEVADSEDTDTDAGNAEEVDTGEDDTGSARGMICTAANTGT